MTIQDFINQHDHQPLDFDGFYGPQCVDLAQYWSQALGYQRFWGDAHNIYDQAGGNYVQIANTPDGVPQGGDIVVWSSDINGGPGHVAVATGEGNTDFFVSFDQNWNYHSYCETVRHNYNFVLGWLRPKSLIPAPTPEPIPQPAPEPVVEFQPAAAEPQPEQTITVPDPILPPVIEDKKPVVQVPEKLKSRKLWVAVATVAILCLQGQYNQAVAVVLGYLGIQGYIDGK